MRAKRSRRVEDVVAALLGRVATRVLVERLRYQGELLKELGAAVFEVQEQTYIVNCGSDGSIGLWAASSYEPVAPPGFDIEPLVVALPGEVVLEVAMEAESLTVRLPSGAVLFENVGDELVVTVSGFFGPTKVFGG